MDAIKPGFWSDSQPINLIKGALNHRLKSHIETARRYKYLPRAVCAPYVTVCQPVCWETARTRKNIAPVQFAQKSGTLLTPCETVENGQATNLIKSMDGSITESISLYNCYYGGEIPPHKSAY